MSTMPSDEMMLLLSRMAWEKATESLAQEAEKFAQMVDMNLTAQEALTAFAAAIRAHNVKYNAVKGAA